LIFAGRVEVEVNAVWYRGLTEIELPKPSSSSQVTCLPSSWIESRAGYDTL
jgi:hypothetical protein